jgi:hypothetical protein
MILIDGEKEITQEGNSLLDSLTRQDRRTPKEKKSIASWEGGAVQNPQERLSVSSVSFQRLISCVDLTHSARVMTKLVMVPGRLFLRKPNGLSSEAKVTFTFFSFLYVINLLIN